MPPRRLLPIFVLSFLALPAATVAPASAAPNPQASAAPAPPAATPFWPDGTYEPKVPTPESVLGYAIGDHLTDYRGLEAYLRALQPACTRMTVSVYGESYERRPLYILALTSPKNLAAIETVRLNNLKLADPRRLSGPQEAETIIKSNPAIAWMNYANDGNETAAVEAAIQTMYQLCAGTDPVTLKILEQTVVIITPALNPESHERFVSWYNAFRLGPSGSPDPLALEHRAPWGVDTNNNHYQIDLNRDAGLMTQKESREMGAVYLKWMPQVFVDHHGETVNMFFPPVVDPVNANLPDTTVKWHAIFGRAIADGFDRFGWSYFVGEVFDDFYFGYWDTYPNLHGAVGMTFETDGGGSYGLQYERRDGSILTLRDGIHHHFIGTMQTLRTTADRREEKLRDFYAFRRGNLTPGRYGGTRAYLFPPGADPARTWALVETLVLDGVEVTRAKEEFTLDRVRNFDDERVERRTFPAGTYIVPMAQPASAVAQALLEKDPKLPAAFVEAQRKRKEKKLYEEFYDITAWSLPVSFGIEAYWSESDARAASEKVGETRPDAAGRVLGGEGRYGYLIPGDSDAGLALTVRLLREGYVMAVADAVFGIGSRDWPRGTSVVRTGRNKPSLKEAITAGARELRVDVTAVDSAWTDRGPDLGSRHVRMVRMPRVAVVAGEGTDTNSYGSIWFMFEKEYGLPFTPITLATIGRADLRKYDVIILPDSGGGGGYGRARDSEVEALKSWARQGGVLVGVREGARFLASSRFGLTTATPKGDEPEGKGAQDGGDDAREGAKAKWVPESTPGSLLRVDLDGDHYLTMGYGPTAAVLIYSDMVFNPSEKGKNVARFAAADRLRIGGLLWPTAAQKLAGTPYLVEEPAGEGKVILFADDPNFRLMLRGLRRLFMNAVLYAPYLEAEASVF